MNSMREKGQTQYGERSIHNLVRNLPSSESKAIGFAPKFHLFENVRHA